MDLRAHLEPARALRGREWCMMGAWVNLWRWMGLVVVRESGLLAAGVSCTEGAGDILYSRRRVLVVRGLSGRMANSRRSILTG